MPETATTDELLQTLGQSDADVYAVMRAVDELARRGELRAVEPLLQLLRRNHDDWISATAASALGKLGDRRAVELLRELVRGPAASVADLPFDLEGSEDPMAAYAAAVVLHEMDDVRFEAVRALGRIGDPAAAEDLQAVLHREEEGPEIRRAAATALESLAGARER